MSSVLTLSRTAARCAALTMLLLAVFTSAATAQPPRNLAVSNVTNCSALLSWEASTDPDGGVVAYRVQWGDTETTVQAPSTSIQLTELVDDTEYAVAVRAIDDGGGVSEPATLTFVTGLGSCHGDDFPPVPGPITVTDVTTTTALLAFQPGTPSDRVVAYDVFTGPGITDEFIAAGAQPPVVVTELEPDTEYTLCVRARDASGLRGLASCVTFRTLALARMFDLDGALTIPTLLRSSAPVSAEFTVTGSAVTAFSIAPIRTRLKPLGFIPLTADLVTVPSGEPTGGQTDTGVQATLLAKFRLTEVNLFGSVPIAGLGTCQSKRASSITLEGASWDRLSGDFSVTDLSGCGALNGVVTPLIAGEGNQLSLSTPQMS